MIIFAAEKNLNKFAFPVFSIKGRPVNYPCSYKYNDYTFSCEQGRLGPGNWMMMDLLGTIMIQNMSKQTGTLDFTRKIPTQRDYHVKVRSEHHISMRRLEDLVQHVNESGSDLIAPDFCMQSLEDEINCDRIRAVVEFAFSDSVLMKKIPYLNKYSSKEFHDLLVETSELRLSMRYPTRYYDIEKKDYSNFDFNTYSNPSRLFRITDITNSKVSKDNHILRRTYFLRFDTILGYLFVQNCMSSYMDLLPTKFYDMSDYAQLFYRILILPWYNGVNSRLNIEQIRSRLALKTKDRHMLRKVIKRILEELKRQTFIKDFKEEKVNGTYLYSYFKTPWKEIEKE